MVKVPTSKLGAIAQILGAGLAIASALGVLVGAGVALLRDSDLADAVTIGGGAGAGSALLLIAFGYVLRKLSWVPSRLRNYIGRVFSRTRALGEYAFTWLANGLKAAVRPGWHRRVTLAFVGAVLLVVFLSVTGELGDSPGPTAPYEAIPASSPSATTTSTTGPASSSSTVTSVTAAEATTAAVPTELGCTRLPIPGATVSRTAALLPAEFGMDVLESCEPSGDTVNLAPVINDPTETLPSAAEAEAACADNGLLAVVVGPIDDEDGSHSNYRTLCAIPNNSTAESGGEVLYPIGPGVCIEFPDTETTLMHMNAADVTPVDCDFGREDHIFVSIVLAVDQLPTFDEEDPASTFAVCTFNLDGLRVPKETYDDPTAGRTFVGVIIDDLTRQLLICGEQPAWRNNHP